MHNCSETKERLTELVLDGRADELSAAELNNCAECRAEFDALNATLRMTTRRSETAAPAESYWNGYHARLREKLAVIGPTASHAEPQRRGEKLGPLFATMRLCVRTSIPVPLPLALAVILTCLGLGVFAIRRAEPPVTQPPLLVHVPVEVPMVQEKVITRVVYRDRRSPSRNSRRAINEARAESTFAKSRKPATEEAPLSLTGFKPTDEIKLTVIKGGTPYEK
jgi:hypothetical protein